ncbi:Thioredoxin-2, partial [Fragariocoptes setiger]
MAPHHVKDKEDLEQQFKNAGHKLVVIDFHATWCGPCRLISPVLDELETEHAGKLVILKVDVDECEDIATEYNITNMPTFVLMKGGKKLDSFSGANQTRLREIIAKNL